MGQSTTKLWYSQPAKQWVQALPFGNGRLGGMVFGQVQAERIQLNEDSIWYGGPRKRDNPEAIQHLDEIRRLLAEGRPQEAERLSKFAMTSIPQHFAPYQTLGDLHLQFEDLGGDRSHYTRELDLETGVVGIAFTSDGTEYRREVFASNVDQAIVIRLSANAVGSLTFSANLSRRPFEGTLEMIGTDTLVMSGQCGPDGVAYCTVLKAVVEGGTLRTIGGYLSVERADAVTLILTAHTTFRHDDPRRVSLAQAEAATTGRRKLPTWQSVTSRCSGCWTDCA